MKPTTSSLRILFFGMHGAFSIPPFRALIKRGWPPVCLITPPPPGVSTVFRQLHYPAPGGNPAQETLYGLAARNRIPIYEISRLQHPDAIALREKSSPDFIIVACFNRLLPKDWLDAPLHGCINLHPSLLPAYRGPAPLEDQLAHGETQTGITLHFMDEGADTGDIIAQESLPIPPNATLQTLNRLTAERSAHMLLKILERPDNIPRWPQGRS